MGMEDQFNRMDRMDGKNERDRRIEREREREES